VMVVVEPLVLPARSCTNVSGKPTTATDVVADAGEASRWGDDDTPSGTLEEHYWTKLSQPLSSCSPCGRGLHHPR
jgi:hypothetical protein